MRALEIHIPEEGTIPPMEEVPYFFPTQKGWFSNMPTLFGIGQTKIKKPPPGLPELEGNFRLNDRKFPRELLAKAHAFFKAVYAKQKTESSLYILYNRQTDEFRLWAPEQYVSHTSVNHKLGLLPAPWTAAGTIHSHCNFSAFHSGTDQHDMAGMSGLHITIGHVDRATPEYAIALSLGDSKFDVEFDDIITDMPEGYVEERSYPTHWMSFVKTGNAPWQGVKTTYKQPTKTAGTTVHGKQAPSRFHSQFKPSQPSQLQHNWDTQAWSNEDEDWGGYEDFLTSHHATVPVGMKTSDDLLPELDGTKATDAPSDVWNYYKDDIAEFQYDLSILGDQLADLGFDFDWSISWNPTSAQQRMFDESPTP